MSVAYHPLNLALRFLLEVAALAAMAFYGWHLTDHRTLRLIAALLIPLVAAASWGIFAVPADPSRSGSAPVPVPGSVRLVLELAFFAFAAWCLLASRAQALGVTFAALVVLPLRTVPRANPLVARAPVVQ